MVMTGDNNVGDNDAIIRMLMNLLTMMWWHFEADVVDGDGAVDGDGDDKPGEQDIDLDVSGKDDDEGEQEDLGVVEGVVDVRPVRGAAKCQMSRSGSTNKKMSKSFFSVIRKTNLSPQSLSSSFTDPLPVVTFTLVDNPSQKLMVVHWNEKLKVLKVEIGRHIKEEITW